MAAGAAKNNSPNSPSPLFPIIVQAALDQLSQPVTTNGVPLLLSQHIRDIHPASRGVAAHTAGLFRSVRGAKGGFPPWGLPKLRIFTSPPKLGNFHFSPLWGLPKLGNFHFSPPMGASQAREFSLFPPVGAPQAREFSLFPPVGAPQAREFSLFPPVGASQAREFSLFPAVTASQAMDFHFSLPWRLSKLRNFK